MSTNIPGISAEVDLDIEWPELGTFLGEQASPEQAEFLIAFADMKSPLMQAAYIGDDLVKLIEHDHALDVATFLGSLALHVRASVSEARRLQADAKAA